MAQEMMRSMQQAAPALRRLQPAARWRGSERLAPGLEVLTPEQAAQVLGVAVEDVMAAITAGDLKARKIGNAHRIARSALEEFLRG